MIAPEKQVKLKWPGIQTFCCCWTLQTGAYVVAALTVANAILFTALVVEQQYSLLLWDWKCDIDWLFGPIAVASLVGAVCAVIGIWTKNNACLIVWQVLIILIGIFWQLFALYSLPGTLAYYLNLPSFDGEGWILFFVVGLLASYLMGVVGQWRRSIKNE